MTDTGGGPAPEHLDRWARSWSLVLAPGLAKAILTWPSTTVAGVLAVIAVGYAVIVASATLDLGAGPPTVVSSSSGAWPRGWRETGRRAAQVAAGVVALVAVAAVSVDLALVLCLLVVLTSPWCVQWWARLTGAERDRPDEPRHCSTPRGTTHGPAATATVDRIDDARPRHGPRAAAASSWPDAPAVRGDLDVAADTASGSSESLTTSSVPTLTDVQLCLAWRRSFLRLLNAPTPAAKLRIVEERRICLDELERRDATALTTWLASGARAAGSPERYLLHRPASSPTGRGPRPTQP